MCSRSENASGRLSSVAHIVPFFGYSGNSRIILAAMVEPTTTASEAQLVDSFCHAFDDPCKNLKEILGMLGEEQQQEEEGPSKTIATTRHGTTGQYALHWILQSSPRNVELVSSWEGYQIVRRLINLYPAVLLQHDAKTGKLPIHLALEIRFVHPRKRDQCLVTLMLRTEPRCASIPISTTTTTTTTNNNNHVGQLALHVACRDRKCPTSTLMTLATRYPYAILTPDESPHASLPIHLLLECNPPRLDVVRLVTHFHGLQPTCVSIPTRDTKQLPLHLVCEEAIRRSKAWSTAYQEQVLRLLLRLHPAAMTQPDHHGNLPVHIAARHNPKLAALLLSSSSSWNTRDEDCWRNRQGQFPLHIACQPQALRYHPHHHSAASHSHVDGIVALIQARPNHAARTEPSGQTLPLHWACQHRLVGVIPALLEAFPAGLHQPDQDGTTPIQYASRTTHRNRAVLTLLRQAAAGGGPLQQQQKQQQEQPSPAESATADLEQGPTVMEEEEDEGFDASFETTTDATCTMRRHEPTVVSPDGCSSSSSSHCSSNNSRDELPHTARDSAAGSPIDDQSPTTTTTRTPMMTTRPPSVVLDKNQKNLHKNETDQQESLRQPIGGMKTEIESHKDKMVCDEKEAFDKTLAETKELRQQLSTLQNEAETTKNKALEEKQALQQQVWKFQLEAKSIQNKALDETHALQRQVCKLQQEAERIKSKAQCEKDDLLERVCTLRNEADKSNKAMKQAREETQVLKQALKVAQEKNAALQVLLQTQIAGPRRVRGPPLTLLAPRPPPVPSHKQQEQEPPPPQHEEGEPPLKELVSAATRSLVSSSSSKKKDPPGVSLCDSKRPATQEQQQHGGGKEEENTSPELIERGIHSDKPNVDSVQPLERQDRKRRQEQENGPQHHQPDQEDKNGDISTHQDQDDSGTTASRPTKKRATEATRMAANNPATTTTTAIRASTFPSSSPRQSRNLSASLAQPPPLLSGQSPVPTMAVPVPVPFFVPPPPQLLHHMMMLASQQQPWTG